MKRLVIFIKKEIVFTIALLLAVISCAIVRPGLSVIEGIDFRTLVLLFSLMAVVAGLQRQFVFIRIGNGLMARIGSTRVLYSILVLLCFVFSMFLTNDVALITFVPFSVMILPMAQKAEKLPLIVVLQTLAANLGSVLTPLGNPQNLYLYNISGMSVAQFLGWMLPMWVISLVLVMLPILIMKNEPIVRPEARSMPNPNMKKQILFLILFALSLLCVLKILDYRLLFVIVLVMVLFFDAYTLANVDYILLLTFIGFFVFIYNIKQIPEIVDMISGLVNGREFLVGVLSSQIISNVPAAILLSGFTDNYKLLLLAVDVGGMGTLIASMASLISYKLYVGARNSNAKKYMILFTAYNIIYLLIIGLFCLIWYKIPL